MPRSWFSMKATEDGASADIAIYDEIGFWGINAADFRNALAGLGDSVKTLNLRINSPGGDVFDGVAIYNMLARHPAQKIVTVDGLAASMASVIAMAGDRIEMPENAMMMIHNPWGVSMGDQHDMADMADVLGKIRDQMATTYAKRSGQKQDDVIALMDATTWMTADEALKNGFADKVLGAKKLDAKYDPSRFKLPEGYLAQLDPLAEFGAAKAEAATTEATTETTEAATTEAAAETVETAAAETVETTEAATTEAAATEETEHQEAAAAAPGAAAGASEQTASAALIEAERERAAQISAACHVYGHADRAAAFIEAGKSVGDVCQELRGLGRGRTSVQPPANTTKATEVSARHNPTLEANPAVWDKIVDQINSRIGK